MLEAIAVIAFIVGFGSSVTAVNEVDEQNQILEEQTEDMDLIHQLEQSEPDNR